jgi:ADP-ribose pyrophosphatase YjhB (NUDIX family)
MTGPSVSVVGSFRQHYPQVAHATRIFAAAGITVRSPVISRIVNPGEEFPRFESDPPLSADHHIQAATFEKIFASDFVYVVAPAGYVGRTTSYELGRVHERGIPVYFSEPPRDLPIEVPAGAVLDPYALAQLVAGSATALPAGTRPRVSALITADLVIFTVRDDQLQVLLVVRGKPPFKGKLALPGGFVRPGEALEQAAHRELAEETGLDGSRLPLQQLRTYSAPQRDPRGRVVTTAFLAIAPNLPTPIASTDARSADWVEVEGSLRRQLAFDHWQIVHDALERARSLLEYTTVATAFCADMFTISELRRVYEIVWGIPLDPGNFRRKVLETVSGFVQPAGQKRTNHRGRPADLFRRGPATLLYPPMLRTPEQRQTGLSGM